MTGPEKIYLFENPISGTADDRWLGSRSSEDDVEYTRTDAFIDKAAIWFNDNFRANDEYGVASCSFETEDEMFKNFIEYIKGE